MYTDTKNLTVINNSTMQQRTSTAASGCEKSCGRMSKVWKPLLRLLSLKRTSQTRKFHPNNVDLNNTTQCQVTKEDSANIHKQQDTCTEFNAKQTTTVESRLAYQQQTAASVSSTPTTSVISSVYVDKATSPAAMSSSNSGTSAIACTGCIYGRNCQQVHSSSEQEQLNLLNLLNISGTELSISLSSHMPNTLQYLSTDHGLLCLPDDGNIAEHDQLLYSWLYQRFGSDVLPLGTLC